jgi:hypothetical protein
MVLEVETVPKVKRRAKARRDRRTEEAAMLAEESAAKAANRPTVRTKLDMNSLSISWEPPVFRSANRSIAVKDAELRRADKLMSSVRPSGGGMLSERRFLSSLVWPSQKIIAALL